MANRAEEVVTAFLAKWGPPYSVMRQTFEEYLADDCIWENSGLPTCDGKEACLQFLDGFCQQTGTDSIEVEVLGLAASGSSVLTERIDTFKTADGEVIAPLPLSGTLVVRDGKIAAWRDYFDPRPLLGNGR